MKVELQEDEFIIKVCRDSQNKITIRGTQCDSVSFVFVSPDRGILNDAPNHLLNRTLANSVVAAGALNMRSGYERDMIVHLFGSSINGVLPDELVVDDVVYELYSGVDSRGNYVCEYVSVDKKKIYTFEADKELTIHKAVEFIKDQYNNIHTK